jgi:periplasmic protein CpxP/Spy
MENRITTRVKPMARLKSFALPAIMACGLSMPMFAQSTDQASPQPQDSGTRTFGRFHGRHGHGGGAVWQRLSLSDAQKTQMKQIRESYRERTQPLQQELRAKKQGLGQANQGGTFDEALATRVLTESASLQARLMGERFKMRQEMLALLTPEQKNQLQQMREQHKMKDTERQPSQSQ